MNFQSEIDLPSPQPSAGSQSGQENLPPSNWLDALLVLVSSRVSLVRLESKAVASDLGRRLVMFVCLAACLFFAWALVLAGGIALIAKLTECAWYWIALSAAAIHFAAAWMLGISSRKPSSPAFSFTRAEFEKDRAWLNNLQQTRKSND